MTCEGDSERSAVYMHESEKHGRQARHRGIILYPREMSFLLLRGIGKDRAAAKASPVVEEEDQRSSTAPETPEKSVWQLDLSLHLEFILVVLRLRRPPISTHEIRVTHTRLYQECVHEN